MVGPNFLIGFISNWYLSCIKVSFAVDLVDGKENAGVFKAPFDNFWNVSFGFKLFEQYIQQLCNVQNCTIDKPVANQMSTPMASSDCVCFFHDVVRIHWAIILK